MGGDIVDYAVELRTQYDEAFHRLSELMPMPGRPPNLRVAVSSSDYDKISNRSKRVRGALGYTIAADNLIVLNGPKLLRFFEDTGRAACCTIVHELIHIALYNTDCATRSVAIEQMEGCWDSVHPIAVICEGWDIDGPEELITVCCERIYCPHDFHCENNEILSRCGRKLVRTLEWTMPKAVRRRERTPQ